MACIKGVVFDMDGLLVDTEGLHVAAWKELFEKYGIKPEETIYANYAGVADNIFIEELKKGGIISIFLQTDALVREKTEKLVRAAKTRNIYAFPGAKEVISFVSGRFQVAVASNSERDFVEAVLENTGMAGYFGCIVARNDVKKPKPEPDIYLAAAKWMGLLPSECLVFEDSEVGVLSAKKAGMLCVAITTTSPEEKLKRADYVYGRLEPGIVMRLLKSCCSEL
jgi:beta-phosphoglucomutase-like phosphatase (HAD superfamily)